MSLSVGKLPRVNQHTRIVVLALAIFAAANGLAALAYAPSGHIQHVGERVASSRLHPLIAGGAWAAALAAILVVLAFGVLRKRRGAWIAGLAMLGALAVIEVIHDRSPVAVALPIAGAGSLLAMRRSLVAEPYRKLLRRHMLPTADALDRTQALVRAYGRDSMAPFKLRTDVGHLFAPSGDAVLAFRVENRALLVAGDPVGTPAGQRAVLSLARDLARGAGLRFGVSTASEECAELLRNEFGMRPIYMGCEAVIQTGGFSLAGGRIKKVRQAHRRVQQAGYVLECRTRPELTAGERRALLELQRVVRGEEEQSFTMAPESIAAPGLDDALLMIARHSERGQIAGVMAFMPLAGRSMWSLALQLRDPDSPNGVIDALVVHTLQTAQAAGIEAISLNFAAARRYLHEPVAGIWPRVAKALAQLATRWTQIDDLRYHNEKFSPLWERRFVVVDHPLQLPHIAFGTIWQEGQLPRPDAFIRPAWPQCGQCPDRAQPHHAAHRLRVEQRPRA
ncbi:MAG: phosphatidylglycerol lysyltransferase domain-containing protein [Patulibacter sp.]